MAKTTKTKPRFHVNPWTFKAGPCDAKKKCRFAQYNPTHYDTLKEASDVAEALSKKHFGTNNSISRGSFASDRRNIPKKLEKMGIIKSADDLPKVGSRRELVEKWFNGNEDHYSVLSKISNPENDYKESTVKSITKLLKSDMSISLADLSRAPKDGVSHIELIEESSFSVEKFNKKGIKAF